MKGALMFRGSIIAAAMCSASIMLWGCEGSFFSKEDKVTNLSLTDGARSDFKSSSGLNLQIEADTNEKIRENNSLTESRIKSDLLYISDNTSKIIQINSEINNKIDGEKSNIYEIHKYQVSNDDSVIIYSAFSDEGNEPSRWSYIKKDINSSETLISSDDFYNLYDSLYKTLEDSNDEKTPETADFGAGKNYIIENKLKSDDVLPIVKKILSVFPDKDFKFPDNMNTDIKFYFNINDENPHAIAISAMSNSDAGESDFVKGISYNPVDIIIYINEMNNSDTLEIPQEIKENALEDIDSESAIELLNKY